MPVSALLAVVMYTVLLSFWPLYIAKLRQWHKSLMLTLTLAEWLDEIRMPQPYSTGMIRA
jgi:hypothetical protein